VIQDLIRGMVYLHPRTPPVLHRDLNTKNLLLDDHWTTKLGDFGLSRVKDDVNKMTSNVGFLANIAPEVFKGEKYSEKADVFSFGMILYELFTGREPHEGVDILKYANLVSHEDFRPPFPGDPTLQAQAQEKAFIQGTQPFSFVDSAGKTNFHSLVIHPDWKQLIEDCWAQNPEKRPSFSEISSRVNGMVQRKVPSTTKPPAPAPAPTALVNQGATSTTSAPPVNADKPAPAQLHTSGYIT
jgi:serine/threonine protein kinase